MMPMDPSPCEIPVLVADIAKGAEYAEIGDIVRAC
jgi:hypothetical protein